MDVSRETRDLALTVLEERQWPLLVAYAEWLVSEGQLRGLIGPREHERLWDRHLLNSLALAPVIDSGARVADVGSGAGLPGLVLAIAKPSASFVLIDSLRRRVDFLQEVVADLNLTNVTCVHARAEDVTESFDVVTSRAVAALPRLLEWCLPLVDAGGSVLAMKGSSVRTELDEAKQVLKRWKCAPAEVIELNLGEETTWAAQVSFADPLQVGWRFQSGKGSQRGRSR